MYWLLLIFISFHFFSYIIFFRHLLSFRQEQVILLFHVVFFLMISIGLMIIWRINLYGTFTFLGLISLMLIYHMTFLGIWSLIQGSYSMQILLLVALHKTISEIDIIAKTQHIGMAKKQSRLRHLLVMRLAQQIELNKLNLTRIGKFVNYFFRNIKLLAHIKNAG